MSTWRTGGWVLASRVVPQLSGALLLLIGARFLSPEALGHFVMIFAGIECLRRLVRAGWREAVIVLPAPEAVPVAMLLAMAGGLVGQLVAAVAAIALWQMAGLEPGMAAAILLLGFSLIPLAPTAVWEGLLLRVGRPEREAKPQIIAETAHLIVAFLLLANGFGILGLVHARIVRAIVLFVGLGSAAGWVARMRWDPICAPSVLTISGNVTASSMINFATTYGVDLIVGFYLGPVSVAYFRVGSRIAGAVSEAVNETARVLAWSSLPQRARGEGSDRVATRIAIDRFLDQSIVLAAPVFVGLALIAQPLVNLLLGATWAPAAQVVALMAIARLLQIPATVAWPALAIVGKTAYLPRLTAVIAGSALLLILVTGPYGIQAIALSQILASLIGGIATLWVVNKAVFAPDRLRPRKDTLLGLLAMALAVGLARLAGAELNLGPWTGAIQLGGQILAGALAYLAFLGSRRRDLWAWGTPRASSR